VLTGTLQRPDRGRQHRVEHAQRDRLATSTVVGTFTGAPAARAPRSWTLLYVVCNDGNLVVLSPTPASSSPRIAVGPIGASNFILPTNALGQTTPRLYLSNTAHQQHIKVVDLSATR